MHQKRRQKLKLSELTMNIWIDCGLFWLYIYIHERFSLAYLIHIPMFSLSSWFFYCSTYSKSTNSIKTNGNTSTKWAKVLSFVWEKYYFIEKLYIFFLMTFSETLFKPQEYRLINATVRETPMLKKYLNYWNRPFLVWQFIENQVFTISALF